MQPSLAPSRCSRFWPGPLRGTKVRVLEVCGPEPGRPALLTVHLRGERASQEAGVAVSPADSPRPHLLFIHSLAGSGGCGRRPGHDGSCRLGPAAGGTERDATRPFSAEVGRRLLLESAAGLAARRGGTVSRHAPPAWPLAGCLKSPALIPARSLFLAWFPFPALGAPSSNLTTSGAQALVAPVTRCIIHPISSSWLIPDAGC